MQFRRLIYILTVVVFSAVTANGQTFGVKAGLNYNTMLGPTTPNETMGYNSGFHFGISYGYNFSDVLSLRTEISYIQNGNSYEYKGDGFYIIRNTEQTVFEQGDLDIKLQNSLGYLSIPIVLSGKIYDKWEVNGGIYMNFLISPIGRGEMKFISHDRPQDIDFIKSLDYQYFTDEELIAVAGRINPVIIVDEFDNELVTLLKFAGAYEQYAEKEGNLMNRFDAGITAGVDYFLNKGFFIGVSADYGLLDITNNKVDYDRSALNENNSFIFSDDKDTNLGFKVSIGFRF